MTDRMTKEQRSYCMSRIKSKWTKPERLVHDWLKGHKIKHKMHPKIGGSPDILLTDLKTAVFINGCFWHRCPTCYRQPKSNREYWLPKIKRNVEKDNENIKKLKKLGYNVIVIWEHELRAVKKCMGVIQDVCSKK